MGEKGETLTTNRENGNGKPADLVLLTVKFSLHRTSLIKNNTGARGVIFHGHIVHQDYRSVYRCFTSSNVLEGG